MNPGSAFIRELRQQIGEVLDDAYSLGMYSTDASLYQVMPVAVILPKTEEEVRKAIALAGKYKVSILPRGGGTSLAGQTIAEALVIDFSKYLNGIRQLNKEARWVSVQPGLVRDDLNDFLAPEGLHYAPDPATSSRAVIGGIVANNSSGTKSILYGKAVDHILACRVLLADGTELLMEELSPEAYEQKAAQLNREGAIYREFRRIVQENREEIIRRYPKVMRRVGGYNLDEFVYTDRWNLAKLITGSEGTLGTILEARLNLEPVPKNKCLVVAHFAELLEAIRAVEPMLPFKPSAVEILDKSVLDLSRANLLTQRHCHFLQGDPAAIQIVEFFGDTTEEVQQRAKAMIDALKNLGLGYAYPLFPAGREFDDVWLVRKKGLGLVMGAAGDKKALSFIEDAAIPTKHLPEYIDKVLQICKGYQVEVSMYAHASVGVIHVQPLLDLRQAEDIALLKKISRDVFKLVVHYGGSWSGEHGDGFVRSRYNEEFFGPQLYRAFQEIKHLFDPDGQMNPGKIVNAPPMDEHLRYGANYRDQPVTTVYQYRAGNNFRETVHMCTGVGECRKTTGGTMCPSFKATRDEEDSTRGRANALRLAMSGQLGDEGFAGKRLHEVLDLCLSCKACKSECPSNVDMAKMKGEVLQMYYDKQGITLRDRIISRSTEMAGRFAGVLARPVNWLQNTRMFRSALQRFAGFDKRRTLPTYAPESFVQWVNKNGNAFSGPKKVVLFADTYLNFHEPQIGISALQLLNGCGYEVLVANVGCCQRPKISHGFLRAAKKGGSQTVERLRPYLEQGLTVVVCEPGCCSALTDDLADLIDDEKLARQLQAQVMMIDDFLAREINEGHITAKLEAIAAEVLVHGHCHQKALYGTAGMKTVFGATPQQVTEIPSGCCGMAGSFGYETEHYSLSEKVGEEILFPAIRKRQADSVVVANGFSCRHQIEHFTGIKPKHWVETVRVVSGDQQKTT